MYVACGVVTEGTIPLEGLGESHLSVLECTNFRFCSAAGGEMG